MAAKEVSINHKLLNSVLPDINQKMFVKIIFGNPDELFEVISVDEYKSDMNGKLFVLYNIKVTQLIKFVGDFMHSGSDNHIKLNVSELLHFNQHYPNLKSLIDLINDKNTMVGTTEKRQDKLFTLLKNMRYLHKFSRLFLKTYPVKFKTDNSILNVYTMAEDKCLYTNCPDNELTHVITSIKKPTPKSNKSNSTTLKREITSIDFNESLDLYYGINNNVYYVTEHFFKYYFQIDLYDLIMDKNNLNKLEENKDYINMIRKQVNFQRFCIKDRENQQKENQSTIPKNHWNMKIILYNKATKENKDNDEIDWIVIKKSGIKNNDELGVYASRLFKSDEIIGVYLGNIIEKKTRAHINNLGKYAFESNDHGLIDAQFSINDDVPNYYMGMHMICTSLDNGAVNATINDNGLVIATKTIEINQEICIQKIN